MLGPRQFGAFAGVAALAVVLGTLSTLGTHLVLLAEVSREPARRDRVLVYALPSTLLCGATLLAIYLLICTLALSEAGIAFNVLLAIGVTEMWLQPLFCMPTTERLALGRIASSQLLTTLPLALRLLAAATVLVLHPVAPLAAYAYGYLIASVIALAVAMATTAGWPRWDTWRLPTKAELRDAAGYAVLNVTAAGPAELDKTLATRLLPLASAGVYAVGARVIGAATLPVIAMMLSALPRLFREGKDEPRQTAHLLRWIFVSAVAYGLVLAIVLWLIAPVFGWLFGAKYLDIDRIVRWLCLAVPAMALRIAAGNVLMALGKPWIRVGFEAAGLLALIAAAAVLTPLFGIVGMSISLACSEWSMAVLGWLYAYAVPANPKRGTRTNSQTLC
jgi:O-antigen/teichoic acid export membrane protein